METSCPEHNKSFLIACLHTGCDKIFLCLTCHRKHNEDHQTEALAILEKERSWIVPYGDERDSLLNNQLMALPPTQRDTIIYNKGLIELMISNIIQNAQEKGRMLIEEMIKRIEETQEIEQLSLKLTERQEILRKLEFGHYNIFNTVKEARMFEDEIGPGTKNVIKSVEEDLKKWVINKDKTEEIGNYIKDSIEKVLLDHLFVNSSTDLFNECKILKEKFTCFKEDKEKEIQVLKSSFKQKEDSLLQKIIQLKKKEAAPGQPTKQEQIFTDIEKTVQSILIEKKELQKQLDATLKINATCGTKYRIPNSEKTICFCRGRVGCQSSALNSICQNAVKLKTIDENGGFYIINDSGLCSKYETLFG